MPITDTFEGQTPSGQSPITSAAVVTPDDANDLTHVTRAIYIGTAGDLRVTLANGGTLTFVNMVAGWHPIRVTRVWAAGTTADHIVATW